ncbi:hypothetical protein [Tabrizicola sp.]|uniref:hypothetical protein n=1 Tax=Tabrizicola sp. TaxID=2005166 RepID=UPI002733D8B7|nr:hypothetical protein [Tabrizicola sp.]MDP3198123.1 hypothetical protein [Tabrizicola sp.]
MFRLIGFLVMFTATAGGYVFFDYKMSARWSGREDTEGLTFTEYLSGLSGRLAGLGGSAAATGLPTKLVDMMPKPPEGWTVRPTEAADVEGFLPKSTKKADKKAVAAVTKVGQTDGGSGTEVVALTYEKGDRKVVVKAVRYPNIIFTSFAAMQQRMELRMMTAEFRGTEFMTVRGLDVTEDLLPEGFRGRYFIADVGAQIHLRVLAPKRMTDEDLVPFFQTLHVKAMNAGVIDKVEGLGDVPVIVLASALETAAREAYVADVAAREAEATAREAAQQQEAEATAQPVADGSGSSFLGGLFGGGAEAAAPAEPAPGTSARCTTGKDGVKRCSVGTSD